MSDPNNPAAPAAKTRPGSVTNSSYLLYLVAAIFAIAAIISLSTLGTVREVYQDAYAGTDLDGSEGFVTAFGAIGAILQLLFAAAFVALGLFNNRGRNASRIVTWVFGALGLCCTGLTIGGTAMSGMGNTSTGDAPSSAEVTERMNDALPGWAQPPFTTVLSVIALLALLVAVVLLALPPSNEFFRKPKAGWEPPVPGSAYPGYPQAPQGTDPGYPQGGSPGYPPASGDPGYPPAGGDTGYPPPPGSGPGDQPPPPAPPTR